MPEPAPKDESLNEMLARLANSENNKVNLAAAILRGSMEMDPAAIKALTLALAEVGSREVDDAPINDSRFQEIICLLADHIRAA